MKREDHSTTSTKMVSNQLSENSTLPPIRDLETVTPEDTEVIEVEEAIVKAKEEPTEAIAESIEVATEEAPIVEKANQQDHTITSMIDKRKGLSTPSIMLQEVQLVSKTNLKAIQIMTPP